MTATHIAYIYNTYDKCFILDTDKLDSVLELKAGRAVVVLNITNIM